MQVRPDTQITYLLPCQTETTTETLAEAIQGFWKDLEEFRRERDDEDNLSTELGMRLAVRAAVLRDNGVVLVGYGGISPDRDITGGVGVAVPRADDDDEETRH